MERTRIETFIRECQLEADKAIESGNPPFGCVITDEEGAIVARAFNTQNSDIDPTAHAEINALRELSQKLGSWHLSHYVLFANAASCSMCSSAAVKAGITQFYYGAPPEPNMNPSLTVEEIAARCSNDVQVDGPILGDECAAQIAKGRAAVS